MSDHRTPSEASSTPSAPVPAGGPPRPGATPAQAAPLPSAPLPSAPPPPASLPRRATDPPGPLAQFWAAGRDPVPTWVLVAAVVVGLAAAGLVVGHRVGLGMALVGVLVAGVAVPALVRRRAVGDLVTVGLVVGLLAVLAVRDAAWLAALCVLVAVVAGGAVVTGARSAPATVLGVVGWAAGAARAAGWLGRGGANLLGSRRDQVATMLRSVGVTVALLLVFGLLFASADRVFASYLPRSAPELLPARVLVGAFVALTVASVAHLMLAPPSWRDARLPAALPARLGEWLLPVLALGGLVLSFVLVQVGALLGGHQHVLDTAGLTYAQYAREGFGQLVAATALTLVVVALAARRAPRSTRRERVVTRVALAILCLGTLGVVAAALRRMDLYVDAFGLTRLRMLAVLVEVVLGVVLVLVLVAGVRWRGAWLPRAVVQVVAVAVLGLAVINPDAQILRHNIDAEVSAQQGRGTDAEPGLAAGLDLGYLYGLSADVVPAVLDLEEPWRSCLLEATVPAPSSGVAEWNLSRARAVDLGADLVATGAAASSSLDGGVPACPGGYRDAGPTY
ncbi:DUF4173 domain-containing protein [Actinotalea sp. BY-33]|uniref:DUF4173 domain-containing protein n=1 Tax=Actinotalea soli TaxID=2819234 RepID=A0A939LR87_9CELL|nr:DUF4173 domain-containing protein [Actinotalea soli]MBO1753031.1 DUF4173 domain-containing protein [Actinotalea soli]